MKTVVITGGTDGIGLGLARIYLERGDQVVVVGTDKAKAEPGAWFIRADLELIDENRRLINRLSAELDTIDLLVLGARFQRSRRRETADGLESNFALTYLSRFLLSHGLAGLLGRAADPVVLNFGAGRFGPPRWDDLQQRTQYHGLTAMIQAGILNAALAVDFVGRHPAIRYVNTFPGTVATSFAGDYDETEAAQIGRLRATGKSVETAVKEILPFLDSGAPGHPVAVNEGSAVPLAPQASSLADARRLYDYTREVLAR
ncbi:SDR family NAD(P)-dependent oxidoreductase [Streptomyces sp. NBC_01023]|uniref:SDR family NAD(P)-dependent oxidoreductase n=1 Tax=Streptomyces sp. NBC_01023 TaxID=2903724 RepID=UPI003868F8AC|nr:SDR family NAD(P)-dependent oxidoreductase [Streptomyces sp. NBC_01023]